MFTATRTRRAGEKVERPLDTGDYYFFKCDPDRFPRWGEATVEERAEAWRRSTEEHRIQDEKSRREVAAIRAQKDREWQEIKAKREASTDEVIADTLTSHAIADGAARVLLAKRPSWAPKGGA